MTSSSVLIVEDERILAMDLQLTLGDIGYGPVAIASSAAEAVAAATARRPDVVLMDVRIEGDRDGIETAAELRERFDVPVVFLTAHADDVTLERAKLTEPYSYLLKPVRGPELRSALQVAVHKHAMERRLREREAELREQKMFLDAVLETMGDAVIVADARGEALIYNAAARRLLGPAPTTSGPEAWSREYGLFAADGTTPLPLDQTPLWRALQGERVEQAEIYVRSPHVPAGRWHSVNAAPLRDASGNRVGAVTVGRDVTSARELRDALGAMAIRDELTGLLNRRGFIELAEQALRAAQRARTRLALLFADIDDMKGINDELGHEAGDRAIREGASILRSAVRDADLVARLGGDEFAVMARDCPDQAAVDALCARVWARIDAWNGAADRPFALSISMGAVLCDPVVTRSLDRLLAMADQRMYEQKRQRRAPGSRHERAARGVPPA